MGRHRKADEARIIELVNEYSMKNEGKKIKMSDIGAFVRAQGINVTDINIRRCPLVRERISFINQYSDEERLKMVVVHKTLDVDEFINNNHSKEKLKHSLTALDSYYASIADTAVKFKKELDNQIEANRKLKSQVAELKEKVEKIKFDSKSLKERNDLIKYLEDIINKTVYPEIADIFLQENSVYKKENKIINKDYIKSKTISFNTDVSKITNNSLKEMVEDFDE